VATTARFNRGLASAKVVAEWRFVAIFGVYLALSIVCLAASDEIVVAGYNVDNYVHMERRENGKTVVAPKPEKEIHALIQIIKEINPDILGVCEMGRKDDFEDFKTRLKQADLGYTDFEYVDGPDPDRHLVLLSRFPIVSRQSMPDVPFTAGGKPEKVRRGFLDVTVEIQPGLQLRLVGAHLKSKLSVPDNEELVRRNEAHLLRRHVEQILAVDPVPRLLVFGDFNDSKNTPAIQEIMGPGKAPDHLFDLWLSDSVGDHWTEYWKFADQYERIDYIFVNASLLYRIDHSKCGVYRSPLWNEASDHRPVVATIRTAGK